MSLPSTFTDPVKYFQDCVSFLQKYSWIYETSNTCFLRDNVFEKFPHEWVKYFTAVNTEDLNSFPARKLKTYKSTLDAFIEELDKITPISTQLLIPETTSHKLKKMSPKKQHEIIRLSSLIRSVCSDEVDILIDFGSGLGYLSELLYQSNSYKILGLESDAIRVQTATERQHLIYPNSKTKVIFKEHFVTRDSKDFILTNVKELTTDSHDAKMAIIGLHACADLTVNSMKLFFAIENVKKLIIMPCCYHKLEVATQTNNGCFTNFPLSKALKQAKMYVPVFNGFNRPFLRLACQQTSGRFKKLTTEEHFTHSVGMFLRGAAEAIITPYEMVIRSRLKSVLRELSFSELCSAYELHSKNKKEILKWTREHEVRFSELMHKYPNGAKLAEGLTCLQESMQELCENIVLYDRICYMEEQAAERSLNISVRFEKVMDELLSPRCYALIAEKL